MIKDDYRTSVIATLSSQKIFGEPVAFLEFSSNNLKEIHLGMGSEQRHYATNSLPSQKIVVSSSIAKTNLPHGTPEWRISEYTQGQSRRVNFC